MNLIQKYGKKKVCIISSILAVVCIIVGVTTWYVMEENYKQKVLDSIDVTFVEEASIEYGVEEVNFDTFIKEKTGEPVVQLPSEEINTKELGKKQVTYVLSKDGYSKKEVLDVEIKDTQLPVIEFNEEILSLEINEEYDVKSNIKVVNDWVDGEISFSEDQSLTKDGYFIVNDVNLSESGTYIVKLVAFDKNGNKTEKEYSVEVKAKQVELPNTNTGNNGTKSVTKNETSGSQEGSSTTPPINQNTPPPVNKVICPNGAEPKNPSLPCDAVVSGAWDQADPRVQYDTGEEAYKAGNHLFLNDDYYTLNYSGFSTAPCGRNDGSQFHVITPYK